MRVPITASLVVLTLLATGCRGDDGAAATSAVARTPAGGSLVAAVDPGAQRVDGRYGEIRFAVERAGDAGATARFWIEGGVEVVAAIEGPRRGELHWSGHRLRGGPALSPEAAATVAALARSPLATALAAIPLDLACRPGADGLDPALGAALLLPWQMVLGYATADVPAAVRSAAASSECEHFSRPLSTPSPGRRPSPTIVALAEEQPLPVAHGYFPFVLEEGP